MFQLTHVKLTGIGILGDADVDIQPGLTAVVGPNGCGKTTFLRGLMYALTGVIDGDYGKQTSLQADGVLTPGRASVTLSDGNTEITVIRATTASSTVPDKIEVRANGGIFVEAISGRKNVDAYLERKIGVSMPLLFLLCWARQGRLDSILTSSSAVISDFLRNVFDLRYVEKLRSALQDELSTIPVPDNWSAERLQSMKEELDELLQVKDNGDEQKLASEEEKLSRQYEAVANLPAGITAEQKSSRLSAISAQEETLLASLVVTQNIAKEENPLPFSQETLEKLVSFANVPYERFTDNDAFVAARRCRDKVFSLDSSLTAFEVTKSSLSSYIASCDLKLRAIQDRKLREKLLTETSEGTCALCGGHVADPESYKRNKEALTSGSEEEDCAEGREADLVRLRREAEVTLNSIPEKQEATKALKERSKELADNFDLLHLYLRRQTEIQGAKKNVAVIEKQLEDIRARKKEVEETPVVPADREVVMRALLADLQTVRRSLVSIQEDKTRRSARIEMLQKDIAQMEDRVAQETNQKKVHALLTEVRSVFSSQRAQARFMKDRIDHINANLAAWLNRAGLPFTVSLDADSRQFLQYVSGYTHPAAHLSGAQKSIVSVALLLALSDVVAPNLRLFLFDEPGEALDAGNKLVMANTLKAAADKRQGASLVVTRDQEIIDACNYTIQLGI